MSASLPAIEPGRSVWALPRLSWRFVPVWRSCSLIALDADEHRSYVEHWFPAWRDRIAYWRVPDLHLMPAEEALDLIERNVEALIEELNGEQGAPHLQRDTDHF